jgi:hypothetical protein
MFKKIKQNKKSQNLIQQTCKNAIHYLMLISTPPIYYKHKLYFKNNQNLRLIKRKLEKL